MQSRIAEVKAYLQSLQSALCRALENEDQSATFKPDHWQRAPKSSGCTAVLSDGQHFERAGVAFSHVFGDQLPKAATARHPEFEDAHFQALGISMIIHPLNPYVPTMHANLRFFIAERPNGDCIWWFGGGYDLTPYYGFVEDCEHWHRTAKAACDPFGDTLYSQFKKTCDDYFYLKHRKEARGIGGLFFDDLNVWGFDRTFEFIKNVGDSILPAYLPIVMRRKNHPYGQREQEFQWYRRGRYVEFNLIYDRGTLFGLQWGGRVESILVSLPPKVVWRYDWQPQPNSEEARLYRDFLPAKDWV